MRAARTRAERYSRHGRDDQAGAHLKRALHYGLNGLNGLNGLSGFGGVKRALDTGDAGHLTTQEALVGAYEQTEPESRLGGSSAACAAQSSGASSTTSPVSTTG